MSRLNQNPARRPATVVAAIVAGCMFSLGLVDALAMIPGVPAISPPRQTSNVLSVHKENYRQLGNSSRNYSAVQINSGSLGGSLTSGAGAASWASNRLDVFARDASNALIHKWWDGAQWSSWESLGGVLTSDPAAVSWGPDRIDVFVRGSDNALWHRYWGGNAWSGWESLGGSLSSGPEVASWGTGRLDVFARGPRLELVHKWWSPGGWSGWESLGGTLTSDPSAVSWGAGRIDLLAQGTGGAAYHMWWDGSHWNGWEYLGGILVGDPAISSCGLSTLDLFTVGTDLQLWRQTYRGTWSGWQPVGGSWAGGVAAVCRPSASSPDVFGLGRDNALWQYNAGTPSLPPPAGSSMMTLINQDRAANGAAPLQWSTCLTSVAQGESVRQANAGAISHANGVNLDLACGYQTAGENVGYTSAGINDAQLNTMFMNSAGHRANILNPNFHVLGTAWVVAANGYGYITEEFAG